MHAGPKQRNKRKQMVWPLRKGHVQGLLGVAKEMGLGKIVKCRRSHFGALLVEVHFGLFHVCLSQWVYYRAREVLEPACQDFRWRMLCFQVIQGCGVQQLGLYPFSSLSEEP